MNSGTAYCKISVSEKNVLLCTIVVLLLAVMLLLLYQWSLRLKILSPSLAKRIGHAAANSLTSTVGVP